MLSCERVDTTQVKTYNGIDLIKFICSILVVIIHAQIFTEETFPLGEYLNFGLQQYVCRLAVPFYFVSSSFFLFRKMSFPTLRTDVIKNYCLRMLRMLAVWYVLLFIGGAFHLWFLEASVVAVLMLCLCLRLRMRFRTICIVAAVLYTIALMGDTYIGFFEPLMEIPVFRTIINIYNFAFNETTRNGFFMGFAFVVMGAAFAQYRIMLKPKTSFWCFVVSMICLVVEVFLLKYNDIPMDYNVYVFLLPSTFFLFSFAASLQLKDRPIYRRLRTISILVYLSHFFIRDVFTAILEEIGADWFIGIEPYIFFFTLTGSLLFSICLERMLRKEKYKWLADILL